MAKYHDAVQPEERIIDEFHSGGIGMRWIKKGLSSIENPFDRTDEPVVELDPILAGLEEDSAEDSRESRLYNVPPPEDRILGEFPTEGIGSRKIQAGLSSISSMLFGNSSDEGKDGVLAQVMARDMIEADPHMIAYGVETALENAPDDQLANTLLANLESTRRPSSVPVDAISSSLGIEPIDVQSILDKYDEGQPSRPDLMDKDDVLLRILFGLAAGGAQGSRGLYPDIGRVLASAGAGGAGALIEAKKEQTAAQRQYEKDFQHFKIVRAKIELDLKNAQANQKIAVAKIGIQERRLEQESMIAAARLKSRNNTGFSDTASGMLSMVRTQAETLAMLQLDPKEDWDMFMTTLQKAAVPYDEYHAHMAARRVMFQNAYPETKHNVRAALLEADPLLQQAIAKGDEDSIAHLDTLIYDALVRIYLTNVDDSEDVLTRFENEVLDSLVK